MLRVVPFAALQFVAYENYKVLLKPAGTTGLGLYSTWSSVCTLLLSLPPNHRGLPPARRFLAGSLAGCTATLATYPLDLVRAQMAVTARDRYMYIHRGGGSYVLTDFHVVCRYPHVYSVVLQTAREGGVTALWRGVTPTLLGVIPYAGTSFFTYETLKQHYQVTFSTSPPPLPRLAFGAFAGTCALTLRGSSDPTQLSFH